ncbi:hypothetical protein [Defluviicoccus vanus]|uniref:Uncharacterized protein n=1 Tax=Defluviicoccus vanus TaxID=111831 RepID=A0A7H1MZ25_9PROT|nr:hypothetical protein [Defluviicoccus vanus]QNT68711.1 hypothetical protein HQ394_04190 [Defluviicoccus vanus]
MPQLTGGKPSDFATALSIALAFFMRTGRRGGAAQPASSTERGSRAGKLNGS